MSYFSDLVASGQTGTSDPYAGGIEQTPAGGDSRNSGSWNDPWGMMLLRAFQDPKVGAILGNGIAGPPPSNFYPAPPPIPGPQDMPAMSPDAASPAGPAMSPGGATDPRVLATLSNKFLAPPIAAPPAAGGNISDYIRLPVGGQPGSTPFTRGEVPPAGGAPAPRPATPAAPSVGPAAAVGSNTLGHVQGLLGNSDFQRYQPTSIKPDFHDNLLRFGLAAMAAGGKPMATTLGALGEAGTSTFDALQKAKQGDITNTLDARKIGIAAQAQISAAYERLDKIRQLSLDHTLTLAQQAQLAQQRNETLQLIASLSAGNRHDTIQNQRDANDIRASDVAGRAADRQAAAADRQAIESRRVEDSVRAEEARLQKEQKDNPISSMGKTPKQLQYERWESLAITHPDSRQAQAYATFMAGEPADRAAALAAIARGAPRAVVNKRRQDAGYAPLPE